MKDTDLIKSLGGLKRVFSPLSGIRIVFPRSNGDAFLEADTQSARGLDYNVALLCVYSTNSFVILFPFRKFVLAFNNCDLW